MIKVYFMDADCSILFQIQVSAMMWNNIFI